MDTAHLHQNRPNSNEINAENIVNNNDSTKTDFTNKTHSGEISCQDDTEVVDQVSTESFLKFLSTAYKLNSFLESHGVCSTTVNSNGSGAAPSTEGFDMSQLSVLQQNSECADPFSLKLKLTQVLNEGEMSNYFTYI